MPFAVGAVPDNHNPSQVIADVGASGLGLPDRDYYFKDDPRFKQARDLYLIHVANMFKLAGYSDAAAAKAATQVMQVETALAGATLDNIARRDPQATDHKTTFAQLQKMSPHFDWTAYYTDARIPQADLNVDEPAFLAEVDTTNQLDAAGRLESLSYRGRCCMGLPSFCPSPSSMRTSISTVNS